MGVRSMIVIVIYDNSGYILQDEDLYGFGGVELQENLVIVLEANVLI